MIKLKVKLLYPWSAPPYQTEGGDDAGLDLFAASVEDKGHYIKVGTGVAIQPPKGYYTEMTPRSSSYKKGLLLYNSVGIIDRGYMNEIFAMFFKTEGFTMPEVGDRLVQIIVKKQESVEMEIVKDLELTARGMGGFGSTGK